jgi:predicted dehydrogenase
MFIGLPCQSGNEHCRDRRSPEIFHFTPGSEQASEDPIDEVLSTRDVNNRAGDVKIRHEEYGCVAHVSWAADASRREGWQLRTTRGGFRATTGNDYVRSGCVRSLRNAKPYPPPTADNDYTAACEVERRY